MQVTIIGGGSYQWTPKLITDLLATPSLAGCHIALMDIDPTPLSKMAALLGRANEALGARVTVETTTDRRRALEGADFVVVTISTGGFASMAVDLEVPARHGIRQSVGDTVGPGGINRSLRNIPVLVEIGRDMEQKCPDAWLLNITNPMTCLTRCVARETSVKTVGLCHGIGNYCLDLAIAFGVPLESVQSDVDRREPLPGHCRVSTSTVMTGWRCWPECSTSSAGWAGSVPVQVPARPRALLEGGLRPPSRPQSHPVRPNFGGRARRR
jgi:alpha-galactosidase